MVDRQGATAAATPWRRRYVPQSTIGNWQSTIVPVRPAPEGSATAGRPRLLIATGNPGKVREFRRLLEGAPFDVVTPRDIDLSVEVDETGDTYEQNATLKAVAYATASGLLSLADDSGIEVDALDGRPGVRSARYGTPDLDDAGRTALLIRELHGVPPRRRTARYVAVIAIVDPEDPAVVHLFRGVQDGLIGFEPCGTNGFGYDPVFVVHDNRTQAELSDAAKDEISHRGKALRAAREFLLDRYGC